MKRSAWGWQSSEARRQFLEMTTRSRIEAVDINLLIQKPWQAVLCIVDTSSLGCGRTPLALRTDHAHGTHCGTICDQLMCHIEKILFDSQNMILLQSYLSAVIAVFCVDIITAVRKT